MESEDLELLIRVLRTLRGWSQAELASALDVDPSTVWSWERGEVVPRPDTLERIAAVVGLPLPLIQEILLPAVRSARLALSSRAAPFRVGTVSATLPTLGVTPADLAPLQARLEAADLAPWEHAVPPSERDRSGIDDLWECLEPRTAEERRFLVRSSRVFQTWALAERLCHESAASAADCAQRARELSDLACLVAERVPGDPAWSARLLGYCQSFLANALRVGNDMRRAEEAFARAWQLWREGEPADPGLLAEWRLLDLEGSLRRDQRRFAEALDCLDRAWAASPPEHKARILVKKAVTLEHMGEAEPAIEVLRDAAIRVDGQRDPRLSWGIRFNLAANLCLLERFSEAEALLPEIRELATAQRNELDLVRVVWLEGRVAAGTGRRDAAQAAFEQVRRDFAARKMPADGALVTLELAVLLLEQGNTAQVRRLAKEMIWIFEAEGIHREALAALSLFRGAAERERATVELARRVVRYLYRAQHDPDLRFES